ncbi:hypothetical protein V1507DRAFT_410822 [Lipomyces tetrasporus]
MEQGQYVQLLQQTIEQQKEMLAQQSAALVRQQEQTERLHAMFMEHMTQQSAQKQAGDGNPEPKALNQTPTTKTPKAKEPDVFSTGPEKVERFLSEFATYMELTGLDKETARKRILYFKSYLRGPAHDWLKPIVDTSSFEKDSDYDHLIELFSKTFDRYIRQKDSDPKTENLRVFVHCTICLACLAFGLERQGALRPILCRVKGSCERRNLTNWKAGHA